MHKIVKLHLPAVVLDVVVAVVANVATQRIPPMHDVKQAFAS